MTKQGIIELIRYFVHDEDGVLFTDDYLSDLVDRAVYEYCTDTGIYTGKFMLHCDENGFCEIPDNYISFLCAWNDEGMTITKTSTRYLDGVYGDYSNMKGIAMFAYDDIDKAGGFSLCPNPYELQNDITITVGSGYGVANIDGYGVPISEGYGTITGGYGFDSIGFSIYTKVEKVENIMDYQALVYHCLSNAYLADTDYKSADLSKFYRNIYMKHASFLGACHRSVSIVKRGGRFY